MGASCSCISPEADAARSADAGAARAGAPATPRSAAKQRAAGSCPAGAAPADDDISALLLSAAAHACAPGAPKAPAGDAAGAKAPPRASGEVGESIGAARPCDGATDGPEVRRADARSYLRTNGYI